MRRLVLLALIWGWSFLFIKVAVRGLTPATVAWGRVALGLAVILLVLRAQHLRLPRSARSWLHCAVLALTYSAVPFTLLAWGEQHISSALASVLNASTPLFAALVAVPMLGERLHPAQVAGLAVGFAGVAVASGVGASDLAGSSAGGALAVIGVSACYGFAFAYAQRHLATLPPVVVAGGQLVAATAMLLPVAAATTASRGLELTPTRALAMLALGALGTGVAYVLNYRLIADVGATKASVVTYLIPVVAVVVGVLFLDEDFSASMVVGGLLTVAGIGLVHGRLARRRAPVADAVA